MGNRCLDTVTNELRQAGVCFQIERGGKHWKVVFLHGGRRRTLTVSVTPSDWRAWRHARADARRILRQEARP